MRKIYLLLLLLITLGLAGCGKNNNEGEKYGKYFVDYQYIMSYAGLHSTTKDAATGEVKSYTISVSYESVVKLNYVIYECHFYKNDEIYKSVNGEGKIVWGYNDRATNVNIDFDYDYAKVKVTGYSDEDPTTHIRCKAESKASMLKCAHKNTIHCIVEQIAFNHKRDMMEIKYNSSSSIGKFEMQYDFFNSSLQTNDEVDVCLDCGFYS